MRAILTLPFVLLSCGPLLGGETVAFRSAKEALPQSWPTWRGPYNDESNQKPPPLTWSADKNIRWKIPLAEPGNSTPIVVDGKLFLTTASKDGARRELVCYNADDGKELWRKGVEAPAKELTHDTNPYAASSPVTDGKSVYVWHGTAGVAAYDFAGKELWKKGSHEVKHIWGYAASPVIVDGKVILSRGPGIRCSLIALDAANGDEVWRRDLAEAQSKDEKEFKGSWSTPTVYHPAEGQPQILLSLPGELRAFNAATGEDVWTCKGLGALAYTSPLVSSGTEPIAVAMSGYHGAALACKVGPTGDITEKNRLWHHTDMNPQRVGTGAIVGDHLYILNENGVAWCIELATGKKTWEERIGGSTWSSMSHVAHRLYVATMQGETVVLAANPKKAEVLAKNKLELQTTRASLAFYQGRIYIRSYETLYCIEER